VGSPDNGEGFGLHSTITYNKNKSYVQGWTTVETVLIRFLTYYTGSGRFPVHLNKTFSEYWGIVGYDAAVCVRKYDPWIIEAYNTSIISPSILRVVGKGTNGTSLLPSGNIQGAPIANTGYLNATGKATAFEVAHANTIDQMWKINVLGSRVEDDYLPSHAVGSVVAPLRTCLLTIIHVLGRFSHRWYWTLGVYRTLP